MFSKLRNSTTPTPAPSITPPTPSTETIHHSTLLLLEKFALPQFPSAPSARTLILETPPSRHQNHTTFTPDSPARHSTHTTAAARAARERRSQSPTYLLTTAPALAEVLEKIEDTRNDLRDAARLENELLDLRVAQPAQKAWFGAPSPDSSTANERRAQGALQAVQPMPWNREVVPPPTPTQAQTNTHKRTASSSTTTTATLPPAAGHRRSTSINSIRASLSGLSRPGAVARDSVVSTKSSNYTPRSSILSFGTVGKEREGSPVSSGCPSPTFSTRSKESFWKVVREEEEIPDLDLAEWEPRDVTAGR